VRVLVLGLRLAAAVLEFRDEVVCPDSTAVLERLYRIAPQAREADHVARLHGTGKELILQLDDRTGTTLASGRLPDSADCNQLADAAALMLAAWEAEFAREPPPTQVPVPPPREVVSAPPSQTVEAREKNQTHVDLAALALATADGQGVGAAFDLDATFGSLLMAIVLADTPHTATFGPGDVHWQRTALGVGGAFHLRPPGWDLSARAVVLAALLARWGTGYGLDEGSVGFDLGLGAGLRAGLALSKSVSLLADFSAIVWPLNQALVVAGVPGSFNLPIVQLYLGLGIRYGDPW
jgi:hypothetical protein